MNHNRELLEHFAQLGFRLLMGLLVAKWTSLGLVVISVATAQILLAAGDFSGAAAARAVAWIAAAVTLLSLIALVTLLSLREWIRATDDLQDTEFVGQTQQRSDG